VARFPGVDVSSPRTGRSAPSLVKPPEKPRPIVLRVRLVCRQMNVRALQILTPRKNKLLLASGPCPLPNDAWPPLLRRFPSSLILYTLHVRLLRHPQNASKCGVIVAPFRSPPDFFHAAPIKPQIQIAYVLARQPLGGASCPLTRETVARESTIPILRLMVGLSNVFSVHGAQRFLPQHQPSTVVGRGFRGCGLVKPSPTFYGVVLITYFDPPRNHHEFIRAQRAKYRGFTPDYLIVLRRLARILTPLPQLQIFLGLFFFFFLCSPSVGNRPTTNEAFLGFPDKCAGSRFRHSPPLPPLPGGDFS